MSDPCPTCAAPSSLSAGWNSPAPSPSGDAALAAHVSDFSDPHRTLELVPGTTLAYADPGPVDGVRPGQRHVNLSTLAEFICADVGSGPEWVQVSPGGWTAAELALRLAGYARTESLADYVTRGEFEALPVPDLAGYATESDARGYAGDALADAVAHADGAVDGLRARIDESFGDVVRRPELDAFALRAELAAYATASALDALRRASLGVWAESDSVATGRDLAPYLAPYATLAALAAKASAVSVETLRRASVGVWSESDSGDPAARPAHRLSDLLSGYALRADLSGYVTAAGLESAVSSAVSGFVDESEAAAIARSELLASIAGAVDPADTDSPPSSAAVDAHVRNVVMAERWSGAAAAAAAALASAGIPGGLLAVPPAEESESLAELGLSPSTTGWYDVPQGVSRISVRFPAAQEPESGSESESESVAEPRPARDAVLVLALPQGWSGGAVEVPGAVVYGTEPDTLGLAGFSGGDVVAVALHEIAPGTFMASRRMLHPQGVA